MLEVTPLANAVSDAISTPSNAEHIHVFGNTENETLSWDELERVYQDLAKGIIDIGTTVNFFTKMKELYSYIEKEELSQVSVLIKGLSTDLGTFTDILLAIHSQHEDLKGDIVTEDEISHAGTIMGEYGRFATHLQSATMHTSTRITATFEQALLKMSQESPEDHRQLLAKYFNEEV